MQMILIVCGVSGTGKSTVGQLLAEEMKLPFFDADDFHPESNVQKMQSGVALNDEDRQPWLESLSAELVLWESNGGAVLACSALKETYREILASQCKNDITWIILNGSRALLMERLNSRKGHYFDPRLLDSQLDTLELPDYGWIIDVQSTPEEIVSDISQRLREQSNASTG
jgi:6-phosphogluconate dehydrogenase/gluconokinase